MSSKTIIALILVVLGIVALGPIQATKQEHHSVPLPPIVGAIALVGGIIVLISDRRGV
jgi:uncharacterized membrane protein HdeD (DUF308 family)